MGRGGQPNCPVRWGASLQTSGEVSAYWQARGLEAKEAESECLCSSAMAEVVIFHHALGLTDSLRRFAARVREAGHTVHMPDLYDGRIFDTIEDGMAYSEELGGPMAIVERARAAVGSLPSEVVYVGFSLGVLSAQSLAQTRPDARGAVLCYSALPLGQWGGNWPATWPEGVRLQLHILEGDEDFEIAQGLAATVPGAELFVYPGTEHYFAEHDDQAAAPLRQRILAFLG
jgi:dienelactone hydrolase